MTMELLSRILKENKIPENVHFMSDSGWECDPTEMDGVFYNRKKQYDCIYPERMYRSGV